MATQEGKSIFRIEEKTVYRLFILGYVNKTVELVLGSIVLSTQKIKIVSVMLLLANENQAYDGAHCSLLKNN